MSKALRVLLIEDNPGDVDLISEMLEEHSSRSYELYTSDRLETALSSDPENCTVDVVLMDLGLPDSTGIETLEKFLEYRWNCAVIVITGLNDEETGRAAVKMGAQDYLIKGQIDSTLLHRAVIHAIERKQSEEKIKRLLAEKEQLLHEVHHRIKNNLSMVGSFLSLQSYAMSSPEAAEALEEAQYGREREGDA